MYIIILFSGFNPSSECICSCCRSLKVHADAPKIYGTPKCYSGYVPGIRILSLWIALSFAFSTTVVSMDIQGANQEMILALNIAIRQNLHHLVYSQNVHR